MSGPQATFEKWFKLLVEHKFGIAAVPVAGLALGYFILVLGQVLPEPFKNQLAMIGVFLMGASAAVFILAALALILVFVSREFGNKNKQANKNKPA